MLTEDGMHFKLWNASTGEMYDIQDVHCPLQGISCLVTENNVRSPLRFFYVNSGFISLGNNTGITIYIGTQFSCSLSLH